MSRYVPVFFGGWIQFRQLFEAKSIPVPTNLVGGPLNCYFLDAGKTCNAPVSHGPRVDAIDAPVLDPCPIEFEATCFAGGLELVLSCSPRVVQDNFHESQLVFL